MKKDSKIDISNIKIPNNYVLVKPDENYSTFQFKGRETNISTTNFIYEGDKRISVKERNYSIHGTVYAVPLNIIFNKEKIKKIINDTNLVAEKNGESVIVDSSKFDEVARLGKCSLNYETKNELNVGDRVAFSYTAHMYAMENGAIIDTDHGPMYFIKYDSIYMSVDTNHVPLKMINGYILVKPEIKKNIEKDGALEYSKSKSGLIIPNLKTTENRTRKNMHGVVLCAGKPIGGYHQLENVKDPNVEVNAGDRIIFDPRGSRRLESINHQEYSDTELYLIQRKDIYFNSLENPNFDTIEIERKRQA